MCVPAGTRADNHGRRGETGQPCCVDQEEEEDEIEEAGEKKKKNIIVISFFSSIIMSCFIKRCTKTTSE